jgi:acyl-CoA synthetase (AMP-forming)/AMP-acid ligase II
MIDVETLHGRTANNRWDRVCVGDIIERVTWSTPNKTALVATPDAVKDPQFASLTFFQANTLINQVAQALLKEGLERSARVALYCENSVEAYVAKLAIAKAGLVAVPINVMMSLDVVTEMLTFTGALVAIVDQVHHHRVRSAIEAAGVRVVAVIGAPESVDAEFPRFADFAAEAPSGEPEVTIAGDDIWEILLTSGTTSRPKAVMISHAYSHFAALSFALTYTRGLNAEQDLKIATFLPVVYHVGDHAFVLSALLCGGSVVLGRVPNPQAIAAAISEHAATGLWAGSPQLLKGVVEAAEQNPELSLKSLTVALYGWGSVPPPLFKRLQHLAGDAVRLVGLFGQTEAIACHRFRPDLWPELYERTAPEINYVGMPTPLLAATVVDQDGNSLLHTAGVVGEAVYRSPVMMAGYYRDPEATHAAFRDGWFHSQDACEIGENGLRIMVDRYKDMVKSGGENVSSIRVEAVLHEHPDVTQAAVIGVPDDRWGEAVTAAVILKRPGAVTPEALIAFCRARLAAFETPKRVVIVDALPTTVGGKVQKHKLRQSLKA